MKKTGMGVSGKRKSRSNVIIDEDDMLLLDFLSEQRAIHLSKLQEKMKISRTGVLNHITRLENYGWAKKQKSDKKGEHRINIVLLTDDGKRVYNILSKAYNHFLDSEKAKIEETKRHLLQSIEDLKSLENVPALLSPAVHNVKTNCEKLINEWDSKNDKQD